MLKTTKFVTGTTAVELIDETLQAVFNVVCSTMGPNGNVVVIQQGTTVKTTKDGATVARAIEFDDFHAERINRIIAEAATKTEEECGDGTTTTIYLTKYIYDLLKKYPGYINHKFIEKLVNMTIKFLEDQVIEVKPESHFLEMVAKTTANQDLSISDQVIDIYRNHGSNIKIEVKEGSNLKDVVHKANGRQLPLALSHTNFADDGLGGPTNFGHTAFIMINGHLKANGSDTQNQFFANLQKSFSNGKLSGKIVIAGSSIDDRFANMVAVFNQQYLSGNVKIVTMKTNFGGALGRELLNDMACALGTKVYNDFSEVDTDNLVFSTEHVVSTMSSSVILDPTPEANERINQRVIMLENMLNGAGAESHFSPIGKLINRRISALRDDLITVYVGGETPNEIKERKDRYDDVVLAVRSALSHGVLPGCGTAMKNAGIRLHGSLMRLTADSVGSVIEDFVNICLSQWKDLLVNVGELPEGEITVEQAKEKVDIMDLSTGDRGTPEQLGIMDTAYASITALRGGFATAKILANTSSIILTSKENSIRF